MTRAALDESERGQTTVRARDSMPLHGLQRDWDDLAELDPLWSILADPDKRYGKWDLAQFFATGDAEIEEVLKKARQLGHPARWDRALDFGCGVGRLTRAMAAHFAWCYGVDISPRMVDLARSWNQGVRGCEFIVNDRAHLRLFADGHIDFVYTRIVLQHMSKRRHIESYVAEFVRVLRSDGLLVFELPSFIPLRHRVQGRRRLYAALRRLGCPPALLYRTLGLTPIGMTYVPESEMVNWIATRKGRLLSIDRSPSREWVTSTYYVTK